VNFIYLHQTEASSILILPSFTHFVLASTEDGPIMG